MVAKAEPLSVLFEHLAVQVIFEYCLQFQEVVSAPLGRSEVVVAAVVAVVVGRLVVPGNLVKDWGLELAAHSPPLSPVHLMPMLKRGQIVVAL